MKSMSYTEELTSKMQDVTKTEEHLRKVAELVEAEGLNSYNVLPIISSSECCQIIVLNITFSKARPK